MSDIKELFESVIKHESEYIDLWCELCSVESPTSFKEGVDNAIRLLTDFADRFGWRVEHFEEKLSGNPVCITMNPESTGAPIALSGHIDTVHAVGSFGKNPVHTDENNIYGPGACDCKGGIIAALYAMAVLDESGYKDRPIKLIIQTDEETSSLGSQKRTVDFMYRCAESAEIFINLEAYNPGKATVGRKGILKYEVKVTGFPMHSSLCYEGVNAITEAAHQIIELEKYKEREGITFNCGVISGGTTSNTVAGECVYTVDIRFPDEAGRLRAEQRLRDATENRHLEGTNTKLIKLSERCAMEATDKNRTALKRLNSAFEKAGLPSLSPAIRAGGSDAADMTARGLSCVDSLGVTGGYIHTVKEYATLASLSESARRIMAAVLFL